MRFAVAVGLMLGFLASSLAAQELDIFDPSDFVDPRDRGAIIDERTQKVNHPGRNFLLVRGATGGVYDYQWHNRNTTENAAFLHLTTNYYRRLEQFNIKATILAADRDAHIPLWRLTGQYGRYYGVFTPAHKGKDLRLSGRLLVTWSLERNTTHDVHKGRGGEVTLPRDFYGQEFGLQWDALLSGADIIPVVGTFSWTRKVLDEDEYADRLAYFYRAPEFGRLGKNIVLNVAAGIGADRTRGDWHYGTMRVIATGSIEVPALRGSLNVAFAPTYVPNRSDRRFFSEVSVYFDRTLHAHLGDLSRR